MTVWLSQDRCPGGRRRTGAWPVTWGIISVVIVLAGLAGWLRSR
ncbi:MAG TPA: hypothetical protein VGM53_15735 [Streptosporangiaceae bacterium]